MDGICQGKRSSQGSWGAEQVNYARCILAAMSFVLDHLESITLPKGLVSLLRNELDESTRTGIGHTLLKFSGRRQPGCFWATFRTPTHFLFHQKHHFHATIYPENDVEASGRCLELKKRCLGSRRRQPGC